MNFQDFLFEVNCINWKTLSVMSWISQTSEIKSIKESFKGSTIFEMIHLNCLINYSYSFRKQPTASFFKNNNCCFLDQGRTSNVGYHTSKSTQNGLELFIKYIKVYFMQTFAAVKASLAYNKNRHYDRLIKDHDRIEQRKI